MDLTIVDRALDEMRRRRGERRESISDVSPETRQLHMRELRSYIFSRKMSSNEAFHPLTPYELAVLEDCVDGYIYNGSLVVCGDESIAEPYRVIRYNNVSGTNDILPDQFREASDVVTRFIFSFLGSMAPPLTIPLFVWRAGLAFGEAALGPGLRHHAHLGVCRNERTLQTEVYFEEYPGALRSRRLEEKSQLSVLISDPMLASGHTAVFAIRRLETLGIPQKNIKVVSVVSAPEGVDHVLSTYPAVQIITGAHDERLNERAYITGTGVGDYGDLYFAGLDRGKTAEWHHQGIVSDLGLPALNARMEGVRAGV